MASASMVGFIGLGLMGSPMAVNLARAGTPLLVWNRSPAKTEQPRAAGAQVTDSLDELFARCGIVVAMLSDERAVDAVLARHDGIIGREVDGTVFVHMGTIAPDRSVEIERALRGAGCGYVEAPVSGSRVPAEQGELVAMLAGDPACIDLVTPILAPLVRQSVRCGAVPSALLLKLAVNIFLITMVSGLAESVHFARGQGLDVDRLVEVLDAGPMASAVSRLKLAKLAAADYRPQAAVADVRKNSRLVVEAARRARLTTPLIELCDDLFREAVAAGYEGEDMIAVIRSLESRTQG